MKNTTFILLFLFFWKSLLFSQEHMSIEILNLETETARVAVNQAFKDLKLPNMHLWKNHTSAESSFYLYTSFLIKNRFIFKVNIEPNLLTVSISNRQYQSKSNWVDNPLPMSKQQAAKILGPLKEKILELTKNKIITQNSTNPTNPKTLESKKAGIYEDFVIIKTDDAEMDLLALHKNGNRIGYNLSEDKAKVKSVVFKENKDAEAVIMLFDKNGSPISMVTDKLIVNISNIEERIAELTLIDSDGKTLGAKKIELPVIEQKSLEIQNKKNTHGPNSLNTFKFSGEDFLSKYIVASSTITKDVACVTGILGGMAAEAATAGAATPIVIVGVIAACESLYFDLVAKYVGKDHFLYDELNLASDISSIISVINPLDSEKWVKILSMSNDAIPSLKNAYEVGLRKWNNYLKKNEITIEGPAFIKIGKKNDNPDYNDSYGAINLYIKTESPDAKISWSIKTEKPGLNKRLAFIHPFDKSDKNYRENYSGIELKAKENLDLDMMSTNGNIVEKGIIIEAKMKINGKEFIVQKEIEIRNPFYYFLPYPDCSRLFELKLINVEEYERCSNQEENCKNEIWNNGDKIVENNPKLVSAILSEHILSTSGITDPAASIDSESLNFIRKIWKKDGNQYPPEESGQFRDFVKSAYCMSDWSGLDDKKNIIKLAHEAMDKIESNNEKVKTLQKAVEIILKESQNTNDERFIKIASDIKNIDDDSKQLKKEYADKMNEIAKKGTVVFAYKKTDKSSCYNLQGNIRTKGVHWSPWLTVMLEYDFLPNSCEEKLDYGAIFKGKGVSTITFKFIGEENKEIMKAGSTIPGFSTITMDINEFEQTELIEFFKSDH